MSDSVGNSLYGCYVSLTPLASPDKEWSGLTDVHGMIRTKVDVPSALRISYLGYQSISDTIQPGQNYSYRLIEDAAILGPVVVTSHAVPTRIEESVFKIHIIDRKRIEGQGAMNLRDLLTNDLNIKLNQDPLLGAGLKMQGVGGENIKIMIDGVPLLGRLDGNIDLSQITLSNIEQVEIIQGPSSIVYGSDALGGVINLITKKSQNNRFEGGARLYYETVGNYNVDGRLGLRIKRHFLQFSGGRYFFDGFTTNDSVKRFQTWKPKQQYFFDFGYSISIGKMNLRYQSGFLHEIMQSKGKPEPPFYISATDQYFTTIRNNHSVFLNGYVKKNHHLDIMASYAFFDRERRTLQKDLVTLDEVLVETGSDRFMQWLSRGMYNYNKPSSRIHVQAGYELSYENAEGPRIKNGKQWVYDMAAFGGLELRLLKRRNLWIKPGIRLAYNSNFNTPVIPALHLKYSPIKGLDLRASYARGYRAPSLKELYFQFVDVNHNLHGNVNLRPEHSDNFNAHAQYQFGPKKWNQLISISGFYNHITDQIRMILVSAGADSNVYRNENIASFQSCGGTLNWNFGFKEFNIGLGASYTGIRNGIYENTGDSIVGSNNFVFYPEFQLNSSYRFKWWNGTLNLFIKYTGTQPVLYSVYDPSINADVIMEGRVDGFCTLDVSYMQNFFKNRFQLGLYGKNLLNVTDIRQTQGMNNGGAHSSGSSTLPAMYGASFGVSFRYNFAVK